MSLFTASLNSGSNGNCYYVGNEKEAVLIDAGISCREIEKRMRNLNLNIELVKALFISHEHIDHIRGVVVLARKYQLPVYITPDTLRHSQLFLEKDLLCIFNANEPVSIGNLSVIPFAKFHDGIDPYSFLVEGNGVRVGVITDIGIACKQVVHYFKQCHACFLETNYDEQMLESGGYPIHLKNRIRGDKGHLSNLQALQLFLDHKPAYMSHLFLSHLSKNNNCPELVLNLFENHAVKIKIVVASRDKETDVYAIRTAPALLSALRKVVLKRESVQMSLFE